MMQTAERLANTEAAIWARVVRPKKVTLSRQLARFLLDLEFPEEEKARMHELAVKARAGTLTPEEEEEIDSYGRVGSLLSILKSKARQTLKAASKANGPRS